MNEELRQFVKESLERGQSREAIREALLRAGWQERDLRNALTAFADVDFPVAVPRPRPNIYAREAFLYLVSFIALYVSAFSFGALLFGLIDYSFPDSLARGGSYPSYGQATAIAAVIVAFPVYLLLLRWLTAGEASEPERRQSPVRRWLTYLTLVAGAGIILGDLIALLSSLLAGDPTLTFALKAAAILVIAGAIFGYYLWQMRQAEAQPPAPAGQAVLAQRLLLAGVLVVVIASLSFALFLIGSPGQQRDFRLDQRRIDDLRNISRNIDRYRELNGQLPGSLEELTGPRYSVRSITDPETGAEYAYLLGLEDSYQLCAVFTTNSADYRNADRPFSETVWDHREGRDCFRLRAQPGQ